MKSIHNFVRKPEGKLVVGLGVVFVALFAYYAYARVTNQIEAAPVLEVTSTDHVRGAAGAKVTLVEFGDFQCPACGAYEPIVRQVQQNNPDVLQVVFRHFPLTQIHRNALLSAKAAEAAALQGKFWEMHDMLYDRQKEWSEALNARDIILSYATALNLDTEKFSQDLQSSALESKIFAEYKEGLKLGVQGTPTFFVNGVMIENPQSVEALDKIIKAAAK